MFYFNTFPFLLFSFFFLQLFCRSFAGYAPITSSPLSFSSPPIKYKNHFKKKNHSSTPSSSTAQNGCGRATQRSSSASLSGDRPSDDNPLPQDETASPPEDPSSHQRVLLETLVMFKFLQRYADEQRREKLRSLGARPQPTYKNECFSQDLLATAQRCPIATLWKIVSEMGAAEGETMNEGRGRQQQQRKPIYTAEICRAANRECRCVIEGYV